MATAGALAVVAGQEQPPTTKPATTTAPATQTTRPADRLTGEAVVKAMGKDFKGAVESIAGGQIDWTRGLLIASGTARVAGAGEQSVAMARRGARLVAARNVVLLLGGIRAGPGGRFPQIEQGRISVKAVVRGLQEISWKFDPKTMTVTVKVSVPIYGVDGMVRLTDVTALAWHSRSFTWAAAKTGKDKVDVVVIDARGTGFLPCLTPRLTDAVGSEVFSLIQLGAAEFKKRGMVVYLAGAGGVAEVPRTDPALVAAAKEAYDNPLLLRAGKSPQDMRGTLVLTDSATKELKAHGEAKALLHEGRVIVVVDVPAAKS